jgi:hypothetical protein
MSIFGSLFSFNFDNCSCLFSKKTKDKNERTFYENKLMSLQENIDIKVLPFLSFLPLTDIFPESNHVAGWSTYVNGKNKRLVVSQDNLQLSDNSMLNKKYDNVLDGKNGEFFDTVFQMIISGHENQFLMVYKEKLYFANCYCFRNEEKAVIGGILFIRLYTSMSELLPKNHTLSVSIRKSKEYERAMKEITKVALELATTIEN